MAAQSGFEGLSEGLLQGMTVRAMIQRQQDEHQAMLTNQALHDQQMSVQDIMNRQYVTSHSRPVVGGTIQDQMTLPDTGKPTAEPSTIGDYGGAPSTPPTGNDTGQGGTAAGRVIPFARKPDASRTIKLKDSQGGVTQHELFTPEEETQRALKASTNTITADAMAKADAAQKVRQQYGIAPASGVNTSIGVPEGTKWLPAEWDKIAEKIISATKTPNLHFQSHDTGDGHYVVQGFDPQTGALKSTTQTTGKPTDKEAQGTATDDNGNVTHYSIKDGKITKTPLGAIGKTKTQPSLTPGETLTDTRLRQRQAEEDLKAKKKDMEAVQQKEDDEHATRLSLGAQLADPSLTQAKSDDPKANARRSELNASMTASTFKIKAYQSRKAAIAGAQVPDQQAQSRMAEGQQRPAPDGHVWEKKGGIVYFVK